MEWMKFVKWYPGKFPELNDMPFKNYSTENEKKNMIQSKITRNFTAWKKTNPETFQGKKKIDHTQRIKNQNNIRFIKINTEVRRSTFWEKIILDRVLYWKYQVCGSVLFSCSVVSDSMWPHGLQHPRLPCPSPTPGVYSYSCPSSRWCHPAISSSVVPFSSCPQSFPASGSFQMSQLSASGGQSIGVSASTSVLPVNIQDWFPLGWTGWISLQSKGLSRVFSNTTVQKHQFFGAQLSL